MFENFEFAEEEVRNTNARLYTSQWESRQLSRAKEKLFEHFRRLITMSLARMMYEDRVDEFMMGRVECVFNDMKAYTRFAISEGVNFIALKDTQFEFADTRECVVEFRNVLLELSDAVNFEMFRPQIEDELAEYDRQ